MRRLVKLILHWFPPDQRTRLYSHEEILRMPDSLKCHARKLMGAGSAIDDRGIVGRAAKARKGIKEFLSVCLRLILLESGIPQ
jgi:hypothetical protein